MQKILLIRIATVAVLAFVASEGSSFAKEHNMPKAQASGSDEAQSLSLSLTSDFNGDLGFLNSSVLMLQSDHSDHMNGGAKPHDYRQLSDFFNVREANVNTVAGEWEMELEGEWVTGGGGDDDFEFTPNLKYGLNDDMYLEVEVLPLTIGDGEDEGNGDIAVQLFNQFTRESETLPAIAAWIEARLPTGEGSSGVDGELHLNLTKTIAPDIRGHFEGFTKTANGGRGDDGDNRRSFQWGAGVGLDYQVDDLTICTINYLNSSSEQYGNSNQQIIELGGVREIAQNQHLKVAVDVGLDGNEDTPDFGFKVLWSVEW